MPTRLSQLYCKCHLKPEENLDYCVLKWITNSQIREVRTGFFFSAMLWKCNWQSSKILVFATQNRDDWKMNGSWQTMSEIKREYMAQICVCESEVFRKKLKRKWWWWANKCFLWIFFCVWAPSFLSSVNGKLIIDFLFLFMKHKLHLKNK